MSSRSSTSRHITFTKKSGNYMAYITCDQGDVYVDYKDEASLDNSNYSPLFSPTNFRTLELNIVNSLGLPFGVTNVQWMVNGEDVVLPQNGLTNIYVPNGTELKIQGSIAAKSGNQSITVSAKAMVQCGNDISSVYATYHIPVRQSSGDVWHVTIAATDNKSNYTIASGAEDITVQCLVFDPTGTAQPADKFKYEWYKFAGGTWQLFSNNTNTSTNQLTIKRDEVDNQAMFMVKVFAPAEGGGFEADPLGIDTQMIYDAQDEYFIDVVPSRTEEIEQGSGDQVDYCIGIRRATSEGVYAKKANVSFFLHAYGDIPADQALDLKWDSAHTDNAPSGNPPTYGPNSPMFSVTEQHFIANGGSLLTLDICAEIFD